MIIEEYISTLRGKVLEGDRIISKNYLELSEPVKKRIIHEYIQQFDLDYDFKKINELYDFIEKNITKRNGSTISLATALWLYVDERYIETIPRKEETAIPTNKEILIEAEGEYKIGDKILLIKPYVSQEVFVFPEATANFVYVDLSKIKTPIVARTRRDGDIINPFGMQGSMKLKKYLNSKGVNRHRRDEILLLAKDDEILWVAGVGLSNKIAVDKTPTHVIEVL